ncbi:hypothetical protein D7V97_08190 [Corallococcus sp. CA053C]|uniref:immunity 52 family protein n=1 Tax=Corallococcus sp. CA053C TaxID=2316732 RepID=UPI000EA1F0E7|nr:immunity 52 family protein [Corallococcus sp. CA053C]RKH12513.1 hypothetical protein D7V97_08190 [Corallococcus sp. CA053C]
MIEKYYVGAYWPGRVEPVESYARRAEVFFRLLARCDPEFLRWFEKAGSRATALQLPVAPDGESLRRLFESKYRRGDGEVSFSAWNGASDGASSSVRFACGSTSEFVGDTCVLELPPGGAARERLLTAPVMEQALRAAVLAWEPDQAIATSTAHRDQVSEDATPGSFVGWIMYFARQRGPVPPLPAPVRIEPVGDQGTLIILTPERFTASNPEHVALAARVQELLDRAGLLTPPGPRP